MRSSDNGLRGPPVSSDDPSHERMNFQLLLRRRGIVDHAVLKAMDEVPREEFVEPITRDEAYADAALPIACGQTISQPFVVAYMTEQLQLRPHHRVLEIGTGSGYQAAVLSHLAAEVVTVERFRTLADRARLRLAPARARQCRGADGGRLRSARRSRRLRSHHGHRGDGRGARRRSRTGWQGTACCSRRSDRRRAFRCSRASAARPTDLPPKSCSRFASCRR